MTDPFFTPSGITIPVTCEPVTFLSEGLKLKGILHLPHVKSPPLVVGSHGLLSTGDSPKQIALAHLLNQRGIAYFRFDHRGCGASEGDFATDITFEKRSRDLENAIRAVRGKIPEMGSQTGLFGSSMGGATVIAVSKRIRPRAIVTLAAPVRLSSINVTPEQMREIPCSDLSALKVRLDFNLSPLLSTLKNILIFHGGADQVVPVSNALEIFRSAQDPKRLILQQKGDHSVSDPVHQNEFLRETAIWLAKNLLA